MKKQVILFSIAVIVVTLVLGSAAQPSYAAALIFAPAARITGGTIGVRYVGYSFCRPQPATGLFCGRVLPANPATAVPRGGKAPYTFRTNGVGLPFGLAVNLNGIITGTPNEKNTVGVHRFQVCATDHLNFRRCGQTSMVISAKPFTITATKLGTGTGTLTYNPASRQQICNPACQSVWVPGTQVTVTATPDAGSTFDGWGSDCAGTDTCNLVMSKNRNIAATFTKKATVTATVDSVSCTFSRSEQNGSETINYFEFSASGTATGVENQTEVKPYFSTSTATYLQSDSLQSSGGSWTISDPDYSAFRRGTGEPATTTWTYSDEIYIISGSDWTWPTGSDNRMAAHLIEYDGENFARGALDTVYKNVTCAQP